MLQDADQGSAAEDPLSIRRGTGGRLPWNKDEVEIRVRSWVDARACVQMYGFEFNMGELKMCLCWE